MKNIMFNFFIIIGFNIFILNASFAAQVTHRKIKSGDTLYSLLKQNQFEQHQLLCVLDKKTVPSGFTLVPGEKYQIISSPKRFEIKFYDNFYSKSYVFWRKGKKEGGCETVKENFRVEHVQVKGKVRGSLISSILAFLPDKQVAYRFLDAYVLEYNLPKLLQRGAAFSFTVEKLFDGPHFIRYGEITRTEIDVRGSKEVRQFITENGGGAFINPGDVQSDHPLFAPVDYVRISSTFQPRRLHPIKRTRQAHLGIDFELPAGEPIYSAAPGRVLRLGRTRGAGRFVVIRHSNGIESYYNHMNSISSTLKKGSSVSNGQQIGTVGCTGYCTKPHLHFAVKRHGRFVNPGQYLKNYSYLQKPRVLSFFKSIK